MKMNITPGRAVWIKDSCGPLAQKNMLKKLLALLEPENELTDFMSIADKKIKKSRDYQQTAEIIKILVLVSPENKIFLPFRFFAGIYLDENADKKYAIESIAGIIGGFFRAHAMLKNNFTSYIPYLRSLEVFLAGIISADNGAIKALSEVLPRKKKLEKELFADIREFEQNDKFKLFAGNLAFRLKNKTIFLDYFTENTIKSLMQNGHKTNSSREILNFYCLKYEKKYAEDLQKYAVR